MAQPDRKDMKILYELDLHSRRPHSEIARKVGLSKDAVAYRIRRLQEEGIIKQFHTVIDVGKLGFISFRLYVKFQNTTPEKEREIVEYLARKEIVTWIVSIDGDYDLGMWILARSIGEVNALWKEFLGTFVNQIDRKQLTIFTRVAYYPRSYLLGIAQNLDEYVFVTEPVAPDVDEKDLALLRLLAPDARIPALELARKLGITPKTASARIASLERRGVIVGYRTVFDLEKLGYQYFKLHLSLHNVTPERVRALRGYIKAHPNVTYDNEVLGGDDIEIDVQLQGLQEFRALVMEFKERFSDIIREHTHMSFYKEHKFVFLPV